VNGRKKVKKYRRAGPPNGRLKKKGKRRKKPPGPSSKNKIGKNPPGPAPDQQGLDVGGKREGDKRKEKGWGGRRNGYFWTKK